MNKLIKIGRFAYLLPYVTVPFVIHFMYRESLVTSFAIAYLLPFAIESAVIFFYPVCWILSVLSFSLCYNENKRKGDDKARRNNRLILLATVVWGIVHVALIIAFICSLEFVF